MDDPATAEVPAQEFSPEEKQTVLFFQLVMQQVNMAMLLLGRTPPPEGAKPMRDLQAARMFIDQLEALQAKTRGNLAKEEDALLKQNLMALHLAFVEAAQETQPAAAAAEPSSGGAENKTAPAGDAGAVEEESRTRFSKKYSS